MKQRSVYDRIKGFLRSFSFRAGLIFFIALATSVTIIRIHIYHQSVEMAYDSTRSIINANAEWLSQNIEKYGMSYGHYLVDAIIEDTRDKRLYLLIREGKQVTGNLPEWPHDLNNKDLWQEVTVTPDEDKPPVNLLVKVAKYKNRGAILIGYDLQRVDFLRDTLFKVGLANVFLSLVMSFLLSIAVVWLINRNLAHVNRACEKVMRGQLQYRVGVRGSGDQFDKLGNNINSMLDWIGTLLRTVGDSSNALAHDMRTPLSRHRIELESIINDPDMTPAIQEKIREAVTRVDGIVEMFDNILNIAKAESRSGTELFAKFNMSEAVEDVLDFYDALIEDKSQKLAVHTPSEPLWMVGDKQLISQAVMNLIDNAVKYTGEGGEITVSLRTEGSFAVLTVGDNGPGIPEQYLNLVKERFFRVDESRGTPGTGLGLSLVHAVAGLHHGVLTLSDNSPGLSVVLRLSRNIEQDF